MRYDFLMAAFLFAMGGFLLILVIFSLTRRELMLGFVLLGLLALANSIFAFGYAAFILADSESAMLQFNHIQYIAIPFIYLLWYLISLQQRTRMRMLPINRIWLLLIIPIVCLLANFLFPWNSGIEPKWFQQLYFVSYRVATDSGIGNGYVTLLFKKGPMYYALMGFQMLLALLSARNYFLVFRKSESLYKRNLLMLMIASLIFAFLLTITMIRNETAIIDSAPLVTGAFAIFMLLALYKYEFFDLIPFAYRQLFQGSALPVVILDKSKTLISANSSARKIYGGNLDFREILSLKDFDQIDDKFNFDLEKTGEHETVLEKNGDARYYKVTLESLRRGEKGLFGYLLRFIDVTDHKVEMQRMEVMATYDDLTQTYNRRVFYNKASEAFDQAVLDKSRFAFIMFDLDNFKEVNDIYGHQAGDMVLVEMAGIVRKHLADSDIFSRYGGEEFIIYCSNRDPDNAYELAEKLRYDLGSQVFEYNTHKIKVTASFGVSGATKQVTKSFEHYIKDSDDGLYRAKNEGKNKVVKVQ